VIPGSGASFIPEAVDAGADVLVTGDVSHHRVVGALDRGMAVIDAGHVPTERPGLRALTEMVAARVETIDLVSLDPTPWR
jgi:putative NIF3 family GTP cyclohydrolase 1 type 2